MKRLILAIIILFTANSLISAQEGGDERIRRQLEGRGLKFSMTTTNDFKMQYETTDGRTQLIFINSKTEKYKNFEVREIWSPAYKFTDQVPAIVANRLLSNSYDKILGGWQTHTFGGSKLASFAVKAAAELEVEDLINIIESVVKTADAMEKELSGADDL
ncbi:MAG: hypothetical protein SFU91_00260 [Chloroherpetonaceae bacterium]|nr:hypothetical protein [Chloroherpetonaceae bacterium]